jgi:hypothetical protein
VKNKQVLGLALALAAGAASFAQAAEINGVKMADHVKVAGKTLNLNGVGMRKVYFIKVKVYAGALYLEHATHNADEIIASDELKSLEMVFVRNVGAKDIAKAWDEGFEHNCVGNCEPLKPSIEKLKGLMSDMKDGDVMAFNFYPEKTDVLIRGKDVGSIEGREFSKNMLRCWLGKHPPNEDLKSGLLGEKD